MPVEVVLLTSDQAKGLIACAHNGLGAEHMPELFHGQRDLGQPFHGALQRHKGAAQKELEQAQAELERCRLEKSEAEAAPRGPGRPVDHGRRVEHQEITVECRQEDLQECHDRQERAAGALRGIADDYHPFDPHTGQPVGAEAMAARLGERLGALAEVAAQAGLPQAAEEALGKGRRWVAALVGAVGWYWAVVGARVAELELGEEAQGVVYGKLLGGLYWQQAARRGRTPEERRAWEELSGRLLEEAWRAGGPLAGLEPAERAELEGVCREVAGLLCRGSSAVEGRNGRLALFKHGQSRLSQRRLAALSAAHNYLARRDDGTTAAQRFFGRQQRDAFDWLLQRMPDLPRPAAKRPKKGSPAPPLPG